MSGATIARKATSVATINHSCLSSYSFTHSSPEEAKHAILEVLKPEEQPLLPTKGESQAKAVAGYNTDVHDRDHSAAPYQATTRYSFATSSLQVASVSIDPQSQEKKEKK